MVIGNAHRSSTPATLSYDSAADAIRYYSNTDEGGSVFVGIEPFINGNLSISLKVTSDSTYSSVNIIGSTFWLETRSLPNGGARVMSYYQPAASTYAYKSYDVPASALPGGVNTINIMISGTTKTLTVYHDSTYKVTTPLYHWSVQNLPYAPITSPVICFDNYISSVSTWTATYLYGIKETVSGGLVSAVPGNDYVPFGIDYPRSNYNGLGTQYMAAHGQKGVAWADLQWLAYQPQDKAYIQSLLNSGWELGIHYNASLNSLSLAQAQNLMRQQYDQLTQMFGRAPTSWCSYQNADSVTHATYAYQQMGMLWRNGYSGISFIPNVGNLQDTRWSQFWTKISDAQMVYPSFTHKTDVTPAETYSISYANFREWVDNYDGKHIIGFDEYYHRVSNQVDTKITYLGYEAGESLRFSVKCNGYPSRLMIDFPAAANAVVLRNGSPLVLNSDYTIVDGHYIVLFARSNDVFDISSDSAPSAPRGLTAVPGNAQVTLSWTAPASNGGSAITNYKIYRGTTAGNEVLLTTIGNVLTFTDTGRTNGQAYFYKVSAVNANGEGPLSNEASATPSTTPSAPRDLSAAPGNAKVTLTWTAPSSNGGSAVTAYKVYRGTTAGGETLLTTLGNVLSFTDAAVTNGQTYYYQVSAVNANGEGQRSSEASATPAAPTTVPSAPALTSAVRGDASITLTWTAPSSNGGSAITNYKIYRGTTAGGETLLTTVGNVLTFADTGLTNGQKYYYRVSAVNSVGEGPMSNEASATPATVPSAPQNLVAAGGSSQAVLTWSAPATNGGTSITGYKVYRGTTAGNEVLLTTLGNVLTFTDTGLTNGQAYYYKVSAVNGVGESARSNQAMAIPELIVVVPTAPQNLGAVAGNAQVVLTWTAPANDGGSSITGYKIYRDGTLLTTVGNVLTFTDTGLVNGRAYIYAVSAVNSKGEGPQSNQAAATPASLPSAPRNLAAAGGNAQVTLTWSAPSSNGGSSITGYKIYRGTVPGGETLLTTVGNVLTYVDGTAQNGQAFYYVVRAVNAVGEGPQSNEASATPATVPSAPRDLAATAGNGQVTLTWTAPSSNGGSAIIGYKVYRGTTAGNEVLLTTLGNVLTFTDTGLTNGQKYYYKVSAVSSVGEGPRSNEASATPVPPATVPSAPQGLTASPGDGQVVLAWSAPSSNGGSAITGYKIYRGTTAGGETLLTTVGSVLTFTDTGLTNGVTYYYKVSAVNGVGEGARSNQASAIPINAPSDDFEYTLINGGTEVQITEYIGSGGNVVVPSTIDGRPVTSIANYAFYGDTSVTSVTMYGNLKSIGNYAFFRCTALTSVTLPSGLQTIGGYSFCGCTSLTSLTIPGTVTSIGSTAFYGCTALASVSLSSGLQSIGDHAFYGCTALTAIDIPGTVTELSSYAFARSGLTAVSIPGSVTAIGSFAFNTCTALTSVTISNGIQSIGAQAFRDCSSLTSVSIPGTVTTVGGYAFLGCTSMTSLTLSSGIQTIGDYAFCGCDSLTSVTVPGTVRTIGAYAFYYCEAMTSLTLSSGLQSIGDHAFYRCIALTSVTLPSTVTTISAYAFYGCTAMTSMYFEGNAPSMGTGWISARNAALVIYYHSGAAGFSNPWQGVPTKTF